MMEKSIFRKVLFTLLLLGVVFFVYTQFFSKQHEDRNVLALDPDPIVQVPGIPERTCDIRKYGAIAGGTEKVTGAINAAVDDCFAQGGGAVLIPKGTWLTGGIKLKSRINLFLAEGSEIVFSTDVKDYLPVVLTRFQGIEFYNFSPLIYTENSQNIAITGKGKLIGNGERRTDWDGGGEFGFAREKLHMMAQKGTPTAERIFGETIPGLRPSFVQFMNCQDILLDGFTIENGPIWTIHPVYSENFTVRNLNINTWSGNTDGIVVDSTKNVVIEDTFFSTGDDAIAIKSGLDEDGWRVNRPSENIRIENITVKKGNSGVSIGSEMSGGVKNVDIRNSVFDGTRHGFRIKSTKTRGGYIEDVRVDNITMENVASDVLTIDFQYDSALQSMVAKDKEPVLKNIFITNIHGSGVGNGSPDAVINIDGLSDSNMENVHFENISFTSLASAVHIKSARNVFLKNINIEHKLDATYEIERSQNIVVEDSSCHEGVDPCFLIIGKSTKSIQLKDIDYSGALSELKTEGKIAPEAILQEKNRAE